MNYLVSVEKVSPQNGVLIRVTELTPRHFIGKATKLATDLYGQNVFKNGPL